MGVGVGGRTARVAERVLPAGVEVRRPSNEGSAAGTGSGKAEGRVRADPSTFCQCMGAPGQDAGT